MLSPRLPCGLLRGAVQLSRKSSRPLASLRYTNTVARAEATLFSPASLAEPSAAVTKHRTTDTLRTPPSPDQPPFAARLQRLLEIAKRDVKMVGIFLDLRKTFWNFKRRQDTVASLFHAMAGKYPDKPALIIAPSGRQMTFRELETFANKTANYFQQIKALASGDVVALFGTSSVEYVGIWLGLSKLNIVSALVNSNLVAESLINSLKVASPKLIIVDTQLQAQFEAVRRDFPDAQVMYYTSRGDAGTADAKPGVLNDAIAQEDSSAPVIEQDKSVAEMRWWQRSYEDAASSLNRTLFYIFTSGTTGPPKSCIITQRRFMGFSRIIHLVVGLRSDDVIYCPLPIYHTAGGIATVGQALMHGSTVVLRNKFSASSFWEDIIKYKCTAAQYIGEICRFLLAQPVSPLEKQHGLRLLYGQGLRPSVWRHFLERFGVAKVVEMYGSTEGNTGLANMHGITGAVGYLSPVLHTLHPQAVVKVDRDSGEVVRDANGYCVKVQPEEEGELLGQISWDPLKKFDGYTNKKATQSKLLHDVFQKGDKYFRSGDIMRVDKDGFVFFVDRLGDAYRWKGENVSSTEVEGILSMLCGHSNVAVYGVDVPGDPLI
ncbi:long-chain fatty acid transport protein 1-like isoform X2 [Paramacrobiotus metropolitanus]|uniref:long-chain fatty acid transport protein 1-like isoform X2 n=1 Tax=Paramacrobiotus metropolitanus TaxID=2943436 RepID=UPI0024462DE6|nr:long-chain fatty acid transport protein 1-like isoform X2 [Paramacrobiotus metropolitanus]